MCGIVGAIALAKGRPIAREAIEALTNRLEHRGPDGGGVAHRAQFSFGCRRLAIIDRTTRADQPLWDVTKEVAVVHNGEIYNYRELREELRSLGSRFFTESDTEVLVEAYKQWGTKCLSRLEGMFAFAVFDCRTGKWLVARDRIGVKPLYYIVLDDLLVFGSEIKALTGYPGFDREISPDALVRFLRFRYVPFGTQYYKGIEKLPPGYVLTNGNGCIRRECYWDLNVDEETVDRSPDEIAALIESAVLKQLHADVPVSVLLSGGIDSSIIAVHARDVIASGGAAFTARVAGSGYDETTAAATVTSALGLRHEIVPISPLVSLDAARRLARLKDQPLGMHNELAMAELARAVVTRSKVVLCGEGGDELFGGYARIFRSELTFTKSRFARRASVSGTMAKPRIAPDGDEFWRFVLGQYFYVPDADLMWLLRPEFASLLDDGELVRWLEVCQPRPARDARFRQLTYFFIKIHLPGLLEMVDAATMSVGLEARVPYTSHALVEAAFSLPRIRKLRWRSPFHAAVSWVLPTQIWSERCDIAKAVLRDAYRRRLPSTVVNGRKMGFPTPLGRWLTTNDEIRELLLASNSVLADYFLPERLREWYQRHSSRADDKFGRRLWLLTNLGLFLESLR